MNRRLSLWRLYCLSFKTYLRTWHKSPKGSLFALRLSGLYLAAWRDCCGY
jgi:hypothetical protein